MFPIKDRFVQKQRLCKNYTQQRGLCSFHLLSSRLSNGSESKEGDPRKEIPAECHGTNLCQPPPPPFAIQLCIEPQCTV